MIHRCGYYVKGGNDQRARRLTVDTYVMMSTGKEIRDALEAKLELLTLVMSCTSWSSFMTTEWLSTVL